MLESDGRSLVDPARARECFYADADDDDAAAAIARLRSIPGADGPPIDRADPAWRHAASTYVVCRRDQAIHPDVQRTMARHADDVVEWDADHSPFLSQPERVAALLADRARSDGGARSSHRLLRPWAQPGARARNAPHVTAERRPSGRSRPRPARSSCAATRPRSSAPHVGHTQRHRRVLRRRKCSAASLDRHRTAVAACCPAPASVSAQPVEVDAEPAQHLTCGSLDVEHTEEHVLAGHHFGASRRARTARHG